MSFVFFLFLFGQHRNFYKVHSREVTWTARDYCSTYNIIRFACLNRFWNRTEQVELVLTGSILVLFSSEKILSVRFSVLKKWGENRTELNFGNTSPHRLFPLAPLNFLTRLPKAVTACELYCICMQIKK